MKRQAFLFIVVYLLHVCRFVRCSSIAHDILLFPFLHSFLHLLNRAHALSWPQK